MGLELSRVAEIVGLAVIALAVFYFVYLLGFTKHTILGETAPWSHLLALYSVGNFLVRLRAGGVVSEHLCAGLHQP